MSYKNPRITISKKDGICPICLMLIHKGDSIYVEPNKLVCHSKCKAKRNAQ